MPSRGPLDGIRVVEMAVVVAGPAAGVMLTDWGADVVKIEPREGDPQRGNVDTSYFELDNRGKRSVSLDLKTESGRAIAQSLVSQADVFLTNMRISALRRLELDPESLTVKYPRLVYASITGYGNRGEFAQRAGYDIGAFWSRSGMALAHTPRGETPPVLRPGIGDHMTAASLVAGICAALFERERTGRGGIVRSSLLRNGAYALGSDLISQLRGFNPRPGMRRMQYNPLLAVFRTSDDRWFWLLGVQTTRHWPGVCRAIGRPELIGDTRFKDFGSLLKNRLDVLAILDEAFTTQPMDYWAEMFDREDVWWDPLQSFDEVIEDPAVWAAGALRETDYAGPTIATPVDFDGFEPGAAPRAPEAGEHTELVLLELGYQWDEIAKLQADGVIP